MNVIKIAHGELGLGKRENQGTYSENGYLAPSQSEFSLLLQKACQEIKADTAYKAKPEQPVWLPLFPLSKPLEPTDIHPNARYQTKVLSGIKGEQLDLVI